MVNGSWLELCVNIHRPNFRRKWEVVPDMAVLVTLSKGCGQVVDAGFSAFLFDAGDRRLNGYWNFSPPVALVMASGLVFVEIGAQIED